MTKKKPVKKKVPDKTNPKFARQSVQDTIEYLKEISDTIDGKVMDLEDEQSSIDEAIAALEVMEKIL